MKLNEIVSQNKMAEVFKIYPKNEVTTHILLNIPEVTIEKNGKLSVEGELNLFDNLIIRAEAMDEIPFKFQSAGTVRCSFLGLKSLANLPRVATSGFFTVAHAGIENLEGSPDKVETVLRFSLCNELRSCKGFKTDVPKLVIEYCPELKSLDGLQNFTGQLEIEDSDELEEVKYLAKTMDNIIFRAVGLKSLKGCPKRVLQSVNLIDCGELKTLEGIPEIIHKNLIINNCYNLKTFEYLPHEIHGTMLIDGFFGARNILEFFNVHGLKKIHLVPYSKVSDILNKWLPTQNVAKAAQELEKAGFEEWAEY